MSRLQLALNVDDVEAAIAFYRKLFDAEPAKRKPGYANFALNDPPLKLVLIENPGSGGSLNHLGIEVGSSRQVETTTARLEEKGLASRSEEGVDCCYALQDKVWVSDPDGAPWEVYTVLEDTDGQPSGEACCTPSATEVCCAPA